MVEFAIWVAGPSTTAVLSDWGADVIKIEEPPAGDPIRGVKTSPLASLGNRRIAPPYELDNRNKRSVAINVRHPDGRDFALRMLARADVFVSNFRLDSLERLGLDYAHLAALNPRLIHASLNGYGHRGADCLRQAFDQAAGWARSGLMAASAEPGEAPPAQRPGMIDHTAGLVLAGAISAALLAREKTGHGQEVRLSLFGMGLWMNAADLTITLMTGDAPGPESRHARPNPLWNTYYCKDGAWVCLAMVQSDRYWQKFCAALERPSWFSDQRFKDAASRSRNNRVLTSMIADTIATRGREEWAQIFDRFSLIWAPVQTNLEVVQDAQAEAINMFVSVDHPWLPNCRMVRSPVEFGQAEVGPRSAAPEFGQHTEEVALELGFGWEDIAAMKEKGALA